MIRRCTEGDVKEMESIINDSAQAYKGVIPEDRWHEPYMPLAELKREIEDGVQFWGFEADGELLGVMGIQDKGEVDLIRHAYIRSRSRKSGVGTELLRHLQTMTEKPILIGTWAAATWAIGFYEKNGYRLLSRPETERLLRRYWNIPQRQVVTSVVLASPEWDKRGPEGKAGR